MTAPPLVSVIMPVRNGERFIAAAIASIRSQDHPVEIVVVDDGSSDRSAEIAAAQGPEVKVLRLAQSGGAAAARNRALAAASGSLVAFLDCDDLWPAAKLRRQVARLDASPAVDAVFGTIALIGDRLPWHTRVAQDGTPILGLMLGAMVARRSVFERLGGFDERLASSDDVDWTFRLRESGIAFAVLDEVALLYRRHDANMTHDTALTTQETFDVLRESLARRRAQGAAVDLPRWSSLVERPR